MHSLSPFSHFYLKISFYERNTVSMSANAQQTLCWDAWFSVGDGLQQDSQKAPPHSHVVSHPPVSCPVPPSFYSTSHRATVRPPARPYGFYHLSIELSRVKAFNTWVFGTHSKSLSRHLDSFSILKSWPFFFFFWFFLQEASEDRVFILAAFPLMAMDATKSHGPAFVCKPPWVTAPT